MKKNMFLQTKLNQIINNTIHSFDYDTLGRLIHSYCHFIGEPGFYNNYFSYNSDSLLIKQIEYFSIENASFSEKDSTSYLYDNLNRIKKIVHYNAYGIKNGIIYEETDFEYDEKGKIIKKISKSTNYNHNYTILYFYSLFNYKKKEHIEYNDDKFIKKYDRKGRIICEYENQKIKYKYKKMNDSIFIKTIYNENKNGNYENCSQKENSKLKKAKTISKIYIYNCYNFNGDQLFQYSIVNDLKYLDFNYIYDTDGL